MVGAVEWSVGHVAFSYEMLVALPLGLPPVLPRPSAVLDAWELYDSMRVNGAERWAMAGGGQ